MSKDGLIEYIEKELKSYKDSLTAHTESNDYGLGYIVSTKMIIYTLKRIKKIVQTLD